MKVYAIVDKKNSCAEYFLASCNEDAQRIWSVMCLSSRHLFEFLDDFCLVVVRDLPSTLPIPEEPLIDGISLKRILVARREEQAKNAEG